jgi:hypothetical protein
MTRMMGDEGCMIGSLVGTVLNGEDGHIGPNATVIQRSELTNSRPKISIRISYRMWYSSRCL